MIAKWLILPMNSGLKSKIIFNTVVHLKLTLRTEVFNVLNHPQFAEPDAITDTAGFGQITSIVNNPRLIQFALKLEF